jgi:hypothetical protein
MRSPPLADRNISTADETELCFHFILPRLRMLASGWAPAIGWTDAVSSPPRSALRKRTMRIIVAADKLRPRANAVTHPALLGGDGCPRFRSTGSKEGAIDTSLVASQNPANAPWLRSRAGPNLKDENKANN